MNHTLLRVATKAIALASKLTIAGLASGKGPGLDATSYELDWAWTAPDGAGLDLDWTGREMDWSWTGRDWTGLDLEWT